MPNFTGAYLRIHGAFDLPADGRCTMDFLLKLPSSSYVHRTNDRDKAGFITPPLDGSMTVSELYDFHYENNPNHPVFLFANPSGVTRIPFREVVPAAHNAARFVAKKIGIDLLSSHRPRPTVAILAATGIVLVIMGFRGFY